jgi:hypothetical protein
MPRASNVVDVKGTTVVEAVPHDDMLGTALVAADIAAIVKDNEVILVWLNVAM